MTLIRLTCPRGHSWDQPAGGTVPLDPGRCCPVCSAARHETGTVAQSCDDEARSAARSGGGFAQDLPGFELLDELARGGMGVVYKARDTHLNRVVALKVIAPAAFDLPDARERFGREVRAVARLNHPNIVTVYHTELDRARPYLVMEYLPGIDLLRLVARGGPLPVADAVRYIRQAAEGLEHTHARGLVHRDVKPSNLMISPDPAEVTPDRPPVVKLLDLGLARPVQPVGPEGETGLTEAGVFMGTPDYVSPEQAEDPRRADARSDIFSLGGVLYFLLTGEVPFPGHTVIEKVRRVHTEPAPSPAARRKDVPPMLDAVVRKMLARNPAERYQRAADVVAALDRATRDRPETQPETPMSDNFFDRERAALELLVRANRDRAAAEAELAAAFQAAADKAEREVNRARKANAAAREAELGSIDAAHQAAANELAAKFEAEQRAVHRTRDEKRSATEDKYRTASEKGQTEYRDRVWQNDSVLEGKEKRAKDQLESLQRKAAGGAEEVEGLWKEAEPLLARCRVTREQVDYTGDLPEADDDDPINRMQKAIKAGAASVEELHGLFLPKLANPLGLVLCVLLLAGVGAASFAFLPVPAAAGVTAGVGVVFGLGLWFLLKSLARKQTLRVGTVVGERLANADWATHLLKQYAAESYAAELARVREKHARHRRETDEHYLPMLEKQKREYETTVERIVAEHAAGTDSVTARRDRETRAEAEGYRTKRAEAAARFDAELKAAEEAFARKMADATAARDAGWEKMAAAWRFALAQVSEAFAVLRREGVERFPPWAEAGRDDRPLPEGVPPGVRFGELNVDPQALPEGPPADDRLALPAELPGPLPAFLPFPDRSAVVLKTRDAGRAEAVRTLQAAMLRFLTGLPPGKVRFTIIDPVGLGENFAAFMHLADYDEKLVTGQIWTEPVQIEQRLNDLTDHIASVIQKYLRNQYRTIEDYNRAAGEVAEPYRVLVVANFPANFTPEAAKRLVSIVNSGPSCGVCALVGVDAKAAMPRDFALADLEAPSFVLNWRDGKFTAKDPALAPFPLAVDTPPDPATIARLVQRVGKGSKDAARVEVPFDYIAPKPEEVWKGSASKGFEVPVGRAGATRRQSFQLGRGTAQHALVAGKTGSGKSTLLHALITNLALYYSPEEAELYLIDFKEGVEFQWYATYRLPHARVVAIQSEREFGLSVLQRLDGILRERGEKFRDAGVNDLAGYRAAKPDERTPRILLVVDEFQQFFVEDDRLAQEAALLLDRLVRQGRAFGLHVLLGSQTLGGAYSLARSTIDQMAVRVALQCSDADAQLILNKDNTAARLLSRPGEAIYNDQNGLVEGNDPFQVVWLSEEKREQLLQELHQRAGDRYPPPLVFEGNAAADPAKNPVLARAINAGAWPAEVKAPAAWLGDPVAIKDPTAAVFRPLGAANLLLIGQNEDAARGLFAASLVGLATQIGRPHPPTPSPNGRGGEGADGVSSPLPVGEGSGVGSAATFTILDGTPDDVEDAEYLRRLAARLPQPARAPNRSELAPALAELAAELDRRQKGESADRSPRFLFVFAVHRFRELRKAEDDFGFGRRGADREPTPAERFATLLRDGPPLGIHVVVWCDSLTNLNRAFDRPQLREFGMRVLFQMSPTDSSTLMDSPAAAKLGRNRALFLTEESERPEKFRPYGLPAPEWLDAVTDRLRARVGLKEPAPAG